MLPISSHQILCPPQSLLTPSKVTTQLLLDPLQVDRRRNRRHSLLARLMQTTSLPPLTDGYLDVQQEYSTGDSPPDDAITSRDDNAHEP